MKKRSIELGGVVCNAACCKIRSVTSSWEQFLFDRRGCRLLVRKWAGGGGGRLVSGCPMCSTNSLTAKWSASNDSPSGCVTKCSLLCIHVIRFFASHPLRSYLAKTATDAACIMMYEGLCIDISQSPSGGSVKVFL